MCDGHKSDDSHGHEHSSGNLSTLRGTGLPWYRVLAIATKNYSIKARRLSWCCGNNGEPGC